jgi:hypothetical protein
VLETGRRIDALASQLLVCQHLVRACRHALYDIAIDEDGDVEVRQSAIQTFKEILEDWVEARRAVRSQLTRKQKDLQAVKHR